MTDTPKRRPWLHRPLSRLLIGALGVIIILAAVVGTEALTSYRTTTNQQTLDAQQGQLHEQQQILSNQQHELNRLNQILDLVNGNTSAAGEVATANAKWVIEQLQQICVALQTRPADNLRVCQLVPLPENLQHLGIPPTTKRQEGDHRR